MHLLPNCCPVQVIFPHQVTSMVSGWKANWNWAGAPTPSPLRAFTPTEGNMKDTCPSTAQFWRALGDSLCPYEKKTTRGRQCAYKFWATGLLPQGSQKLMPPLGENGFLFEIAILLILFSHILGQQRSLFPSKGHSCFTRSSHTTLFHDDIETYFCHVTEGSHTKQYAQCTRTRPSCAKQYIITRSPNTRKREILHGFLLMVRTQAWIFHRGRPLPCLRTLVNSITSLVRTYKIGLIHILGFLQMQTALLVRKKKSLQACTAQWHFSQQQTTSLTVVP